MSSTAYGRSEELSMNLFVLAWRNVGRNRRRSVLSIAAIAVATLSIVILFSLLEGMKRDLTRNLVNFYTGEVQLRHEDYSTYEHLNPLHLSIDNADATVDTVASLPGVSMAVPRVTVGGAVFQEDERIGLQVVGVNFDREREYSGIQDYVVSGDLSAITASTDRITPALVGNGVLDRLGISRDDTFTVVVRTALRGTNAMTFRAAAIADFPVDAMNQTAVWIPIERARRLAQMPNQAGAILVKLEGSGTATTPPEGPIAAIRAAVPSLEVRHFTEMETSYSFIEMASAAYNVVGLFFFVLASTVIVNTMMMVIFERRREIGTLEAMGMHTGELVRTFLYEAILLSVIGAGIGLVAGSIATIVLGSVGINLGASMEGVDFEISTVLYPVLNFRSTVIVFIASVVVSGITSYIPTRKITRIEPVAALREE
jgi:putative ABC transport system permease protein